MNESRRKITFENALDWKQRRILTQRRQRREAFLRQLSIDIPLQKVLPEEAIQFLLAPLTAAKSALKVTKQRLLFEQYPSVIAPTNDEGITLPIAQRPVHVLSNLNRSKILPQL